MRSAEEESSSRESISDGEIANKVLPPDAAYTKIRLMEVKAGVILCYIVIALLAVILVGIMIYFFASMRHLKLSELTTESLQVYKDARSVVIEEVVKISDQLVAKILLPILTLLLGYIFGSREKK